MPPDPALKRREEEAARGVQPAAADTSDEVVVGSVRRSAIEDTLQNALRGAEPEAAFARVPASVIPRPTRTDTVPAGPIRSSPPASTGSTGSVYPPRIPQAPLPSFHPPPLPPGAANTMPRAAPRPAAIQNTSQPRGSASGGGHETMPPAAFPSDRAPIRPASKPAERNSPAPRLGRMETMHTITQMVEHIPIPRLRVTVESDGGEPTQATTFHDGDECRIGTHPSNDLVLRDRAVSRFHCRIARDGNTWRVIDSSSRNGTRLDGVRVRDAELSTSGLLTVGDSTVRVAAADAAHAVDVPIAPAFGSLAGVSLAMRKLFALLERVAESEINVLIQGESGTGKELVATEIMRRGPRANKPFIVVDCGAISPSLIESELFGHIRGAFTGAERDRIGAFEAANTGTVFLDEIGELPLELQPKLLRALEAKEVRRVGETKPRKIDVRVISATNRELDREVNKGRFREDLYFRLAVIGVRVPPLRERIEDLLLLIRVFLNSLGIPHEEKLFAPEVITNLSQHDWPGNVRELRNYVERTVVLRTPYHEIETRSSKGDGSRPDTGPGSSRPSFGSMGAGFNGIPQGAPSSSGGGSAANVGIGPNGERQAFRVAKESAIDQFERVYLASLMEEAQGNMSKAARIAAMDRMYLHKLVQKHGLRGGNSTLGDF
jgi:DNA-binding NtrC family response regulator